MVFIISVAIIYATAARRFSEFPGEAERANFLAIMIELQTAVNLEVAMGYSLGRYTNIEAFAGSNPMDLLLAPPLNYLGELNLIDESRLPRRNWYFDRQAGELVYLINDNNNVFITRRGVEVPTDQIRFSLQLKYRYEDRNTGLPLKLVEDLSLISDQDRRRRLSGVIMMPTDPFNWGGSDPKSLIQEANPEVSG